MNGDDLLRAVLDRPLPARMPAGSKTSLFVLGRCFHEELAIDRLELLVAGRPTEAMAHSMPRIDAYRSLQETSRVWDSQDPSSARGNPRSYRSGFWATVPVSMPEEGRVEVGVRATLEDGSAVYAPLATIAAASRDPAVVPEIPAGAGIAICMATFNPEADLLVAQLDSIRAQTRTDWICLVSDDHSAPERLAQIEAAIGGDDRFVLSVAPRRLGFYRNFERALAMVPSSVPLVALSDQDDRWFPEKLELLAESLGSRALVYSDQRLVDRDGSEVGSTYWGGARTNNYENLASLLIANTVTGAASLMRRDLLELALPFPAPPGTQYHDHWLALVALAGDGIAYVDRPLYDYVQHEGATVGYEGSNREAAVDERPRPGAVARTRSMGAGSRVSYFFAYCRLRVLAETLLLRLGPRLGRRSRWSLQRFAAAERSPVAVAWLLLRRLRRLRGRTETLDAERIVLLGLSWRYAIAILGRLRSRPLPGVTYDASLPPDGGVDVEAAAIDHTLTRALGEISRPLDLTVTEDAPTRVNLLIPTIELKHLFGGYIAKFNLARKLAESGRRVRLMTVDPTPALPGSWRSQVESYAGLSGLFDDVEVVFARDLDSPADVSPRDTFVATTWWTAAIADRAARDAGRSRFLYLIQEFEPFTHPLGSWSAAAMATYALPHTALFSTELLRRYFAARDYGVYARGQDAGDRDSASFQNAITDVAPPSVEEMRSRDRRKLLFYARPESHGMRNMFELGLLSLRAAVAEGIFDASWDLYGIGSVAGADRALALGGGRSLELLSKRGQGDYAELLADHDLGLSLMYTPHPSLVPIEMASAGMVTVTNSYETKTPEAMAEISRNLLTVPADPAGVVGGLREAVARAEEFEARRHGADVAWSSDWDQSFDEAVMRRVDELLDGG